jgi:hypothetical protein
MLKRKESNHTELNQAHEIKQRLIFKPWPVCSSSISIKVIGKSYMPYYSILQFWHQYIKNNCFNWFFRYCIAILVYSFFLTFAAIISSQAFNLLVDLIASLLVALFESSNNACHKFSIESSIWINLSGLYKDFGPCSLGMTKARVISKTIANKYNKLG